MNSTEHKICNIKVSDLAVTPLVKEHAAEVVFCLRNVVSGSRRFASLNAFSFEVKKANPEILSEKTNFINLASEILHTR